jgi:hypothetical protein
MQRLILIACSKAKLPHAAPAAQLYQGDLFRKARALAERLGWPWAVLSARHGVVLPQHWLAPYNDTLTAATREQRAAWNRMVLQQLGERARQPLAVIAGRQYRGWTAGLDVAVPLAGLGIGKQKARLAEMLKEAA